jgi:hypothetical protein
MPDWQESARATTKINPIAHSASGGGSVVEVSRFAAQVW